MQGVGALLVLFSLPTLLFGAMGWFLHFVPIRNRDYGTDMSHGVVLGRLLVRAWRLLLIVGAAMAVAGLLIVYL